MINIYAALEAVCQRVERVATAGAVQAASAPEEEPVEEHRDADGVEEDPQRGEQLVAVVPGVVAGDADVVLDVPLAVDLHAVEDPQHGRGQGRIPEEEEEEHRADGVRGEGVQLLPRALAEGAAGAEGSVGRRIRPRSPVDYH